MSPQWRQRAAVPVALVLGIVAGAAGAAWWQSPQPTSPPRVDEHAVELALFEVVPLGKRPARREARPSAIRLAGGFLLSGAVRSTVLTISSPDDALDVSAPALPVTVSPAARFRSVELRIVVRDCEVAGRWSPTDRPFTVTWRDEHGEEHRDRAGDVDRALAEVLVRHIEAMCARRTG